MARPLRRDDRRLEDMAAMALLKDGEYGILSTSDDNHQPYGVPVNYAVMDAHIFFHCATQGHKLDNILANRKVSFCVVGATQVLAETFSTRYESVIVSGLADIIEDPVLKRKALRALIVKYAPEHISAGETYMDKLFDKTTVVRISIDHRCGKARR